MRGGGRGFTLIEVMVVLAVIAILVASVEPLVTAMLSRGARTEERAAVQRFADALRAYYAAQVDRRRMNAAASLGGVAVAGVVRLMPDVAAAATPYDAARLAARQMIDAGVITSTANPVDVYASTSAHTRFIALWVNEPDTTAANVGYVNFIKNGAPVVAGATWGAAYCPMRALSYVAGVSAAGTATVADRSLLPLALVLSAGPNGVFDTFGGVAVPPAAPAPDWRSAGFRIRGDDVGVLVSPAALHASRNEQALMDARMERLAQSAGSLWRYRYMQDAIGGVAVSSLIAKNYYLSANTDATFRAALGLPVLDMVDLWGNPVHVVQLKTASPYTLLLYTDCGDYVAVPATAP